MEGKKQQTAAAMAGMSERSARKWQCGPLPSETKQERRWRTRPDPFDGVWEEEILPLLRGEAAGRLRATTIIEWLEERFPGRFSASQLRTLQRRLQTGGHSTARIRRSTSPKLDFTHFKRHKRGNLQYDGTEWRGVSVHRSWRSIVKNPPTPTTSG